MLNNFYGKSEFSEESEKNCFGDSSCVPTFGPPCIFYNKYYGGEKYKYSPKSDFD